MGGVEEELKGREKGGGVAPKRLGFSVGAGSSLRERKVDHTQTLEGGISRRCGAMMVSKVMPDAS